MVKPLVPKLRTTGNRDPGVATASSLKMRDAACSSQSFQGRYLSKSWSAENRDLMLKSANRPKFIEAPGIKIRAFHDDTELFSSVAAGPKIDEVSSCSAGPTLMRPRKFYVNTSLRS